MSKESNTNRNHGIGFLGLLAIVFIVLKLTKVIAWRWLWVLLPLWGPFGLMLLLLFIWLIHTVILYFRGKL